MQYYIHDNFFNDVDTIRNFALNCTFYTKDNHPGDIASFPGYRTDYINNLNQELYNALLESQLEISKNFLDLQNYSEYWTKFSFSYTTEDIETWEHVDFADNWNGFKKFFGGIIYLNPDPPPNTGTVLTGVTTVDNLYNRYVMYDATKPHAVENNFGTCKQTGRLVLTHFIYFK